MTRLDLDPACLAVAIGLAIFWFGVFVALRHAVVHR